MSFHLLTPPCKRGVRLSQHTSLSVGGKADIFFTPQSVGELREEVLWLRAEGIQFRVLGGGTNVVCRDEGFRGAIICTESLSRACHEGTRIRARAGCSLAALVKRCCEFGLSGMEPLVGIPGTVGGALVMNAGGRYGSIGPLIEEVRTLTLGGEEKVYFKPSEHFSYRRGDFAGEVVVEVVLSLSASDTASVQREMCRILRDKLATQPLSAHSAGCVFRNPPGDSAGRLIDACGLKDLAVGGMRVSPVHANFIVNRAEGNCRDFTQLAELVRTRVNGDFGVKLELEVTVF